MAAPDVQPLDPLMQLARMAGPETADELFVNWLRIWNPPEPALRRPRRRGIWWHWAAMPMC